MPVTHRRNLLLSIAAEVVSSVMMICGVIQEMEPEDVGGLPFVS